MKKTAIHPSFLIDWFVLAAFTVGFLLRGNYEFMLYAVTLAILIAIVQRSHRAFCYTPTSLWGFAAWLVMHMCGGFVKAGGVRLYDYMLAPMIGAPFHILRYDQFVHAFCYFVIALLLGRVITARAASASRLYIALLSVLTAMGVGAVNEMIEFLAVAFLGAAKGVGDYYNNALDICFNGLGTLAALPLVLGGRKYGESGE